MFQGSEEFVFTWTIKNYSFCVSEMGDAFPSPDIKADNICGTVWNVTLYPRGYSNEADVFSLGLVYGYEETGEKMSIDFQFELCNAENEVFASVGDKGIVFEESKEVSFSNIISTVDLEKKMKNSAQDILVVRYQMSVQNSTATEKPSFVTCKAETEICFDVLTFLWDVCFQPPDWGLTKKFPISDDTVLAINLELDGDEFFLDIEAINEKNLSLLQVNCEVTYLNMEGVKRCSRCDSFAFKKEINVWQFPPFLKKSLLDEKDLSNLNIFLKFNFSVSNGLVFDHRNPSYSVVPRLPTNSLTDDFRCMLFSKALSDVTFKIESETIRAHKFVLASRSPVFLAMFQQNMAETQTGEIVIADMDVKTLHLFLEFLYTGDTAHLDSETALDLLLAADKYQVLSLKDKCSEVLTQNLSPDNVCHVISVADMLGHEILKTTAIDNIRKNSTEVLGSPVWREWAKNNAILCSDILYILSQDFKNLSTKK